MEKIIIALDNLSEEEIYEFLRKLPTGFKPTIKIGLELFCLKGPNFVHEIYHKTGLDIFLDLKLHDIPQTVCSAIKSLKGLPIKFLTLHLSGGLKMLEMARKQAASTSPDLKLLGVSYLTSLDQSDFSQIWGIREIKDAFYKLFNLAGLSGIHGVVSSPHELAFLKDHKQELLKITPGIRFPEEIDQHKTQDQKRVQTPEFAFSQGADYLVMGRSLTQTPHLLKRLELLKKAAQL
jgi:orotidine-5'-phosphate decarboxylase